MSHYGTVTTAIQTETSPIAQRAAAEFMLEAMADKFGFAETLSLLANVAESKASHLVFNWGDSQSAAVFTSLAGKLRRVSQCLEI